MGVCDPGGVVWPNAGLVYLYPGVPASCLAVSTSPSTGQPGTYQYGQYNLWLSGYVIHAVAYSRGGGMTIETSKADTTQIGYSYYNDPDGCVAQNRIETQPVASPYIQSPSQNQSPPTPAENSMYHRQGYQEDYIYARQLYDESLSIVAAFNAALNSGQPTLTSVKLQYRVSDSVSNPTIPFEDVTSALGEKRTGGLRGIYWNLDKLNPNRIYQFRYFFERSDGGVYCSQPYNPSSEGNYLDPYSNLYACVPNNAQGPGGLPAASLPKQNLLAFQVAPVIPTNPSNQLVVITDSSGQEIDRMTKDPSSYGAWYSGSKFIFYTDSSTYNSNYTLAKASGSVVIPSDRYTVHLYEYHAATATTDEYCLEQKWCVNWDGDYNKTIYCVHTTEGYHGCIEATEAQIADEATSPSGPLTIVGGPYGNQISCERWCLGLGLDENAGPDEPSGTGEKTGTDEDVSRCRNEKPC